MATVDNQTYVTQISGTHQLPKILELPEKAWINDPNRKTQAAKLPLVSEP